MSAKLHIHRHGHNGPALVLIHGWALHGAVFNPLVERLAKSFQLYVVDLPGYGLSHKRNCALPLTELTRVIAEKVPPAIWCGWSMGGLLALHAAATLPQVRGLIMLSSTPCFVRTKQWFFAMEPAVFEQFRQGLNHNAPRTLERFLALNVKGSIYALKSLRYLHQVLNQSPFPDFNTLNHGLDWLQHSDFHVFLPQLNIPNIWIGGELDHLIPAQALHKAAALVADEQAQTKVHILPGCAHVPFIDQPDTVAQLICDFIHAPTV